MPTIIRPPISDDKRQEVARFLSDRWRAANDGRKAQIEKNTKWDKNYRGIPLQATRTQPWVGASNHVVQLIRIYVDTFVARSLNVMYATKPLIVCDIFPDRYKEALQLYINRKAEYEWQYYEMTKDAMFRGTKSGTGVIKSVWFEDYDYTVSTAEEEAARWNAERFTRYKGPKARLVPFSDIAFYPTRVQYIEDVEIKFHRLRYTEDRIRELIASGKWKVDLDKMLAALATPEDSSTVQSIETQTGAQISSIQDIEVIESYFRYPIGSDSSRYYSLVGLLEPKSGMLVDLYFHPYPFNTEVFDDYRPFPLEDFIYGESMCQILQGLQEEVTAIHNDRRNNSVIANSPIFLRRSGSNLPNPSNSGWYPGKVFDLESLDDFDIKMVGRNYDSMLDQEMNTFQLADKLSGIGPISQGLGQGAMGKRGIYNTGGVLGIMAESNQRQDTNIRDIRKVLGRVARKHFMLQHSYGQDDPMLALLPEDTRATLQEAFKAITPEMLQRGNYEIRASDAASNREIQKQNLFQLANVITQYVQFVREIATPMVANPQGIAPGVAALNGELLKTMKWAVERLVRAHDEFEDLKEIIPDADRALILGGGQPISPSYGGPKASVQGLPEESMDTGTIPGAAAANPTAGMGPVPQVPGGVPVNGSGAY